MYGQLSYITRLNDGQPFCILYRHTILNSSTLFIITDKICTFESRLVEVEVAETCDELIVKPDSDAK